MPFAGGQCQLFVLRLRDGNCIILDAPNEDSARERAKPLAASRDAALLRPSLWLCATKMMWELQQRCRILRPASMPFITGIPISSKTMSRAQFYGFFERLLAVAGSRIICVNSEAFDCSHWQ